MSDVAYLNTLISSIPNLEGFERDFTIAEANELSHLMMVRAEGDLVRAELSDQFLEIELDVRANNPFKSV